MPEADLRPLIEAAFADRQLLKDPKHKAAVTDTVAALDRGELRVASQRAPTVVASSLSKPIRSWPSQRARNAGRPRAFT